MKKVITYGTYDLLHYGHRRLLERAKALGDYLIVGVTSEDFDKSRGKINVRQSLIERMQAVRDTGLADEIIVEEYEGQKIDDIRRYGVDIFAIGSDWAGAFDYLKEYCEVIYLDRTEGISSTELRTKEQELRLGLVGNSANVDKVARETAFVNGITVSGVSTDGSDYHELLENSDAVYIYSSPEQHAEQIRQALLMKKHVLCETPLTLSRAECEALFALAEENGVVLMEALKTAFSTAYNRMLLLLKSGKIGDIVSVDTTCTSIDDLTGLTEEEIDSRWGSLDDWGPTGLLPVFQILGTNYLEKRIVMKKRTPNYDTFTRVDLVYGDAVATVKVGKGVKSEGEMVISGTKGYVFVPAPWWKTDFFEVRFEDQAQNKRYFYQLEGEGIRYELVAFLRATGGRASTENIDLQVTGAIAGIMEDARAGRDVILLKEGR